MRCYLCGNKKHEPVSGMVRDAPGLRILECLNCGLVFLASKKHISKESYIKNKMLESTAPIITTPNTFDINRRFRDFSFLLRNRSVLDFGCGDGGFLRKLKEENITRNLSAFEFNAKFTDFLKENFNLYTREKYIPNNKFDFIFLFHVLEHLKDPLRTLSFLFSKLKKTGRIIIETPNSDDALLRLYRCKPFTKFSYFSFHLFLFNAKSLKLLINNSPYKLDSLRQVQRYSLANHLYWLARGKPCGHNIWGTIIDDQRINEIYAEKLAKISQCDTLVAMISKR